MDKVKLPWIELGYRIFAEEGPNGLKVERMAKLVQKNKSSFYHHFADIETFTELLLEYHLTRANILADRERVCKNVVPELVLVLLEFKEDLFFNRQLRFHRDNPGFQACFEKANQGVGAAILGIWATELGLEQKSHLALLILQLSMENFFLQITPETISYNWLVEYIQRLKQMVKAFQHA